jgi:hypothetical protein
MMLSLRWSIVGGSSRARNPASPTCPGNRGARTLTLALATLCRQPMASSHFSNLSQIVTIPDREEFAAWPGPHRLLQVPPHAARYKGMRKLPRIPSRHTEGTKPHPFRHYGPPTAGQQSPSPQTRHAGHTRYVQPSPACHATPSPRQVRQVAGLTLMLCRLRRHFGLNRTGGSSTSQSSATVNVRCVVVHLLKLSIAVCHNSDNHTDICDRPSSKRQPLTSGTNPAPASPTEAS